MADRTRYTANLTSDSNLYVDISTDRLGIGTTNPTSKLHVVGDTVVSGVVTAGSFVKSGGTSSQFLKADGSVDSSTYLTSYTETDTLNSVTGRGNSTSNGISVGILTATSGNFSGIVTSSGAVISGVVTSNGYNATTGNDYKINGTSVLTSTTLGSGVVNSSLTSLGTLGSLNVSGITTLGITSATNLISQQLNVSGITTLAGNVNLGDNTDDDITVSGEFVSNLIPNATNSYDLGSSTQKWKDVWSAGTVTANTFSGSGTNLTGIVTSIVAGTNVTISGSTGQVTINATGGGGGGGSISIANTSVNDTYYIGIASTSSGTLTTLNVSTTGLTFNPSTGNLVAGGTVTANSDESLKTNIKTIENALDKVLALRGVEFDRIDNGDHQIGVIAQEVEKIVPDVVYPKQPAPDYEKKSVAYANLIGLLIEAVKELNDKIEGR